MVYQVMPNLTAEEYAELKSDIEKRGVMVPIEFDENGNVLDGHHRLQICNELGIKNFPKVIRAGMTEDEKYQHAFKLNIVRRHLNQAQAKEAREEFIKRHPEKSDRQIAKMFGVSHVTVGAQRRELESTGQIDQFKTSIGADGKERPRQVERKPVSIFNPTRREERAIQNPAVIERIADSGESVVTAAYKVNKEAREERKQFTLERDIPEDMCILHTADIRSGLNMIEDESVDYIITDPPYPREYLPLYSDLSRLAARVLKPNGSLIAMVGQSYLPEVIARLCENMTYYWCMCYSTPGQSPQLFQKRVNTNWKPLLWFVKGTYTGDYVGDVLRSPAPDKNFHEWGQSVGGMKDIIERFTYPNDVILDPFLGGGTTGIAAVTMGRKFIGVDIEQKNIDVTNERIRSEYSNGR